MAEIIRITPPKPKPLKVGIIVQARMTSTRFPGKSMAPLLGTPVLEWVLTRCKQIRGIKGNKPKVVLAVPDTPESEPMLELADTLKVENFCGSELNVLKRYYDCARYFGFDYIVRVTADCPFLDPRVCSEVLQLLLWRKLDYASNVHPVRSYPRGLDCEAFTYDALDAAYQMSDMLGDHEHVTPWLQRTEGVKKGNIVQKEDKSALNWCVDYASDIERLEKEIKGDVIKIIGVNDND